MSAETLRRAAALMREDAPALDEDRAWHPAVALAVADWLEAAARDEEADVVTAGRGDAYPLAVARAYLGEES